MRHYTQWLGSECRKSYFWGTLACITCRFLSFSRRRADRKAEGPRLGWAKTLGRIGEGVSEKGDGVGRKGITCSQSQTFYKTPFAHERAAIVQFDWFLAHQSQYDIRNLSFMRNPTSGTQQDQNRHGRAWRSVGLRIFCLGHVERLFAKRQFIVLKSNQEAAIRD